MSSRYADLESMPSIEKSPYEGNENAEVGEPVFDDIKSLLIPITDEHGNIDSSEDAARLFGQRLSKSVVDAHDQIGKSGMVFSPNWQDGKIRGIQCGWIPKPMLLLCLHEQRFTRANEAVLQGMIKDLGVSKIIAAALKEWNVEEEYLELSSNVNYIYTGRKQACYKCEIFVARTFRCAVALKRKNLEESTMKKVRQCLNIMNQHVKVSERRVREMTQELEETKGKEQRNENVARNPGSLSPSTSSKSSSSSAVAVSSKRPRQIQILPPGSASAASSNSASSAENSGRPRKKPRSEDREPSIATLLDMFAAQHHRMGETLKVLRHKVKALEQTREEIREEVRAELMTEKRRNGTKKH